MKEPEKLTMEEAHEISARAFVREFSLWCVANDIVTTFKEDPRVIEDTEGVTAKDILDKISEFDFDLGINDQGFIYPFIRFLTIYPKSMTQHDVSDNLKFIIKLTKWGYEDSMKRIYKDDFEHAKLAKMTLSFDDLSRIFLRSKSTIHEIMKDYDVFVKDTCEKKDDDYAEFQAWKQTKQTSDRANERSV